MMDQTKHVLSLMNDLKQVLETEKDVLISNDGEKLVECIQKKEAIIKQLASFNEEDVKLEELKEVSREVKELQETNFLLTQQSLSFTETLLQSIQKNTQKSQTYSKKGQYEKSSKTAFIDESL